MAISNVAQQIGKIDWINWKPVDEATLIFVIRCDQILLIRKKRGLGAGKINGPGGRLEKGETPDDCVARELDEELGIRPVKPVKFGEHRFQFIDGYSIYVHVYRASSFTGTPIETEEAIPMWFSIDAIPFDEMWEDDRLWLPLLLEEKTFSGYWIFENDRMIDYLLLTK